MLKNLSVIETNGDLTSLSLTLGEKDKKSTIAWLMSDLNLNGEVEASDYFDCLLQIREILEKKDLKILCNGARYDVYPSRMSRQMGRGMKAYALTLGKQAMEKDLTNIFDPTDQEKIGTIEDQRRYYNDWLNSL